MRILHNTNVQGYKTQGIVIESNGYLVADESLEDLATYLLENFPKDFTDVTDSIPDLKGLTPGTYTESKFEELVFVLRDEVEVTLPSEESMENTEATKKATKKDTKKGTGKPKRSVKPKIGGKTTKPKAPKKESTDKSEE